MIELTQPTTQHALQVPEAYEGRPSSIAFPMRERFPLGTEPSPEVAQGTAKYRGRERPSAPSRSPKHVLLAEREMCDYNSTFPAAANSWKGNLDGKTGSVTVPVAAAVPGGVGYIHQVSMTAARIVPLTRAL